MTSYLLCPSNEQMSGDFQELLTDYYCQHFYQITTRYLDHIYFDSFHHNVLTDPLTTIIRFTVHDLFSINQFRYHIFTPTFVLIWYNNNFLFYGVKLSGLLLHKPHMSEIYDPYSTLEWTGLAAVSRTYEDWGFTRGWEWWLTCRLLNTGTGS